MVLLAAADVVPSVMDTLQGHVQQFVGVHRAFFPLGPIVDLEEVARDIKVVHERLKARPAGLAGVPRAIKLVRENNYTPTFEKLAAFDTATETIAVCVCICACACVCVRACVCVHS